MSPILPYIEAQAGQGVLSDLHGEEAGQLKEGRSQRGNSTSKGQGRVPVNVRGKGGGGGGPAVRYSISTV